LEKGAAGTDHEVGDDVVAGPLGEEGHYYDDVGAPAGLAVADEFAEIPPAVVRVVAGAIFDDFLVL
jgi:hypothetical protein